MLSNQSPFLYDFINNHFWVVLIVIAFFMGDLLFVLFRYRRNERSLNESMQKTNLLLKSAAEGIYGLNLEGNCTFCNPAGLKLLGYGLEADLLNKNLHQLIHHTHADGTPYPAEDCRICHANQHDSEVHLSNEILWRADGTSFPAEYWSYPLRRGKQTIGAVVSFLDISERKLAEQKLVDANRELDAFVYTVSHDLRTPITAVIGYADLLKELHRQELSDEAMELVGAIETQGEKMSLLVTDLLALATAGNIEAPGSPVDCDEVLQYVLTELEIPMSEPAARVVVESLPKVQIPETLLIQIFENLIGNALRYAGTKNGPIEVGGERAGRRVSFYVRDHGQGIPKDECARIFEVFYRGSTGKGLSGSGVGLATVQKIARLYGGQVRIEETPGGGATFLVELEDALPTEASSSDSSEVASQ